MSNKTQLQANNTKLESLIQTLQGKAAGGGSGGNTLGTCTINVSYVGSARSGGLVYTSVENGELVANVIYATYSNAVTLNNVLCGSAVYIGTSGAMVPDSTNTGIEFIGIPYASHERVYKAPATSGATATIRMYDNA